MSSSRSPGFGISRPACPPHARAGGRHADPRKLTTFQICRIDYESQETQLICRHDEPVRCVEFSEELSASLREPGFETGHTVVLTSRMLYQTLSFPARGTRLCESRRSTRRRLNPLRTRSSSASRTKSTRSRCPEPSSSARWEPDTSGFGISSS